MYKEYTNLIDNKIYDYGHIEITTGLKNKKHNSSCPYFRHEGGCKGGGGEHQMKKLREYGCYIIQGYYYYRKPLSVENL